MMMSSSSIYKSRTGRKKALILRMTQGMKSFEDIKLEMELMDREEFRKMVSDKYKNKYTADIDRVALFLSIVCRFCVRALRSNQFAIYSICCKKSNQLRERDGNGQDAFEH